MNKKTNFEQPVIEIILINSQDVITTSVKFGTNWAGDEEEELDY